MSGKCLMATKADITIPLFKFFCITRNKPFFVSLTAGHPTLDLLSSSDLRAGFEETGRGQTIVRTNGLSKRGDHSNCSIYMPIKP